MRQLPRVLALVSLGSLGCGGGMQGGDAAVSADGSSADAAMEDVGPQDAPANVQLRAHAVNIVDTAAAMEANAYVRGESPELYVSAATFYRYFRDEYDFLYVFNEAEINANGVAARFTLVRRPAIPGTGLSRASTNAMYPAEATRLRGAIGVNFSAVGNGPTLHETLHYWSVFLDARFGFGRDRDTNFGAHWGVAGVYGQHGGFDPSTVQCAVPAGGSPPNCMPSPDGVLRVTVGSFGPNANGGDSLPYAPVEQYLMGLATAAEAGGPFLVFDGAHFVSADTATRRLSFELTGMHSVSMQDLIAVHGERAPAAPEDRAFRGAFVSFSAAPLSAQRMDALERWAAIFGNDVASASLYSFQRATNGRATMSTRLGPLR